MHAHRVDVFDGADDDAVVSRVAHDLHLVLFPAQHGFLDQDFRGGGGVQPGGDDAVEFFLVVGDAAARAAHGEGRADDRGQADGRQRAARFLQRMGDQAARAFDPDLVHCLAEFLPVLGTVDHFGIGADQFDIVFFQKA